MGTIASLAIRITGDIGGLKSALGEAKGALSDVAGRINQIGGQIRGVGEGMTAAVTLPILGVATAAVKMASDLNESANKIDVIFGKSAGAVKAWAESSATALGVSKQEAYEALGAFGNLFKSVGINQDVTTKMSENLVQLSSDLASFNNLDPTEVLEKLRSGMVGQTEPLRSLGINLSEAAVKQQALAMGLASTEKALTPAMLMQARYVLIMKATKDAQGDFARTSDGLANSQRIIAASIKDAGAALGTVLLPYVAIGAAKLKDLVTAFNGLSDGTKRWIVFGALAVAAIGPLLVGFGTLVSVIGSTLPLLGALIGPLGLLVVAIGLLAAAWFNDWGGIREATIAAWDEIRPQLTQMVTWLQVNLPLALSTVQTWFSTAWSTAQGYVSAALGTIGPQLSQLISWLQVNLPLALSMVQTWFSTAWSTAQSYVSAALGAIGPLITQLIGWLQVNLPLALSTVQTWFSTAWSTAQSYVSAALGAIGPLITQLIGWLQVNLPLALVTMQALFNSTWNTISGAVSAAWGVIQPPLMQLWNWLSLLTQNFMALSGPNQVFVAGLEALGAILPFIAGAGGIGAVTAALSALVSPIGLVSAAIMLLGLAWTNNWGGIQQTAAAAWAVMQPIFERLVQSIMGFAQQMMTLGPSFQGLWAAAQPVINALGIVLGVTLVTAVNLLSATFNNLAPIVRATIDQVTAILNLLTTVVTNVISGVTALLNGDWAGAWQAAQNIASGFATYVQSTLTNLETVVSGLLSIISSTVSTTLSDLGFPQIAQQIDAIKAKVTDGWLSIKDSVTVAVGAFNWSDYIKPMIWDKVVTTMSSWGAYIKSLDWNAFIKEALAWGKFIVKLEWVGLVTALKWSEWITSKLTWPTATSVFSWKDWIDKLAWPEIKWPGWDKILNFPGWPDIRSIVTNAIGSIPGVNTVSNAVSGALSSIGIGSSSSGQSATTSNSVATATSPSTPASAPTWLATLTGWIPATPTWLATLTSWTPTTPTWIATLTSWVAKNPDWLASLIGWVAKNPDWLASLIGWVAKTPEWLTTLTGWIPATPTWLATLTSWTPTTPTWIATLTSWVPATPAWLESLLSWRPSLPNLNPFSGNAGGTDSWQGGPTWVGEKGTELVQLPTGKWLMAGTNGPQLMDLPAGTKIFKHEDTLRMMKSNGVMAIGQNAEGTTAPPATAGSYQPLFEKAINSNTALAENTRALKESSKAQRESVADLKSSLSSTPGLMHTSEVTQKQLDMAKLGIPQNFADDWIRHLTDNVINGAHWKDADIKDAALRAGIDPTLPAKAILEMVKDKWNDQSFFADKKNLDLINMDAVKAEMDKQAKSKLGQQNIYALFGIQPDQVAGQAAALGGQLRTGIDQGLAGAGGAGLGNGLVNNMANGITNKTMQPVATKIMGGISASMATAQGDDKQQAVDFGGALLDMINAQLDKKGLFDKTGQLILTKIAGSWGDGTPVDVISKIAGTVEGQMQNQTVIDALKRVGAHMVKIVFAGFDEEAAGQNWTGAVKVAKTGGGNTTTTTPGHALGTAYSSGGWRWVGETGRELMYVPRGAGIMSNPESEQAAALGGGVTVNLAGAVIRDERDVHVLAYQVADIIERRKRRG